MIVPALGFTDCVPFARALDQIHFSKPVLSTPLCTFLPATAYAGGDLPQWSTASHRRTLICGRRQAARLYLKKGLQYGTTVADMVNVFAEIAWEEMLVTVKVMNTIPFNRISSATITAGFKKFPGP